MNSKFTIMKNTLFLLFILTIMNVNAQNDEIFGNNPAEPDAQSSNYLQTAGSKSFEVSFNPGNVFATGGDAFSLINGAVKYRSFSTAQKAFRIGFNVNFLSDTEIYKHENTDLDQKELKKYKSIYGLTLMPGTEKHFAVSDRISPYIGIQGLIGYKHTSYIKEYQDGDNIETQEYINVNPDTQSDGTGAGAGYFSIGAGIFTGVDYYFVKRFYVGIELGIGLQYYSLLNSTFTDSGNGDFDYDHNNGHRIQLAPGLTTGNIRLGWTF